MIRLITFITFRKWWKEVFLPFIRRWTILSMLLMDGCSSHEDLEGSKGQVKVVTYPPNCTSVHQPMDMKVSTMGIIAATKLKYRRELLDMKVSTMGVAAALRAQAKERKMAAGTAGLAEGNHPHVRDAVELLNTAWGGVLAATIARGWVKGKTFPLEMEADLTATHGKVGQGGGSEVAAFTGALSKFSMRVHQADKQGSPVTDKEMIDVLANLDITRELPAGEDRRPSRWLRFGQQWRTRRIS